MDGRTRNRDVPAARPEVKGTGEITVPKAIDGDPCSWESSLWQKVLKKLHMEKGADQPAILAAATIRLEALRTPSAVPDYIPDANARETWIALGELLGVAPRAGEYLQRQEDVLTTLNEAIHAWEQRRIERRRLTEE